jgi:hypothetical protein
MLKLAGLAIAALAAVVIVAIGYWSHRGRSEARSEELIEHRTPDRRPGRTGQGVRTYRQGEDVAKSKSRFGLGERMGWLKRADRDAEMWPEETFGGVSDEQFWDDMSSDKPLATTARTAQPEGEPRRRPVEAHSAPPPKPMPAKPLPAKAAAATTQSFPVSAMPLAAGAPTGPQPLRTGPQHVRTGPQPVLTGPQSVLTGPQPVLTGPQPIRTGQQPTQGLPHRAAAPVQAAPPAPLPAPPQPVRGRHSTSEDPLTSDAFSLRSSTDGRSYRSSRRSAGPSRDQYDAALSQETQTFSLADSPSGGYPAQQYDPPQRDRRPSQADRPSGSYPAQPAPADSYGYGGASQYSYGQPAPASQYGDGFDHRDDRPVPSRESAARESAVAGRPPRPVYSNGSHRSPYDPRGGERR